MKKPFVLAAVSLALVVGFVACEDDDDPIVPDDETYVVTLSGAGESPATNTTATGTVLLTINDNQTVSWTMDLQGIRNMNLSHIHGPAGVGVNNSVAANLFIPTAIITSTLNGRVASGTFGPANVGGGMSYDSLLVLIRNGNAYVNIHTSDPALATNNTAGDYPSGEIRGQTGTRQP